ncbi:MAG: NmrA family protein [Gemmatimonadetes bacterium]|nr:NmrA family protein [Gemmatimonadota bacterium]
MILVVGATGVLGSEVCRRLRARGLPVRALVRAGSTGEAALRAIGVEVAQGDLREPETLRAACQGIASVISTATAMGSKDKSLTLRAIDHDGQLQLVQATANAGVERFVYLSVSPALMPPAPLVRYKREVERAVRASGMTYTILQPSVFMEIWLGAPLGWDVAAGRATVFGAGTAPMRWISVGDVAEHAVRALDDPRLANRELPLGGPEGIAPNEVVRMFERRLARRFKVTRLPRPLLRLMAPVASMLDEQVGSGIGMGAQSALGDSFETALQAELALPLLTMSEYVERALTSPAP